MPFDRSQRTTRRRSSADPRPSSPCFPFTRTFQWAPSGASTNLPDAARSRQSIRRGSSHLSDGQLAHISKEAAEVLDSLERRITDLEQELGQAPGSRHADQATTKRDVTHRFIRAIEEEQEQRRSNPALRNAAGESLPRTFLEVARHRLPGATFDSLLQEALSACERQLEAAKAAPKSDQDKVVPLRSEAANSLPVVVSPNPEDHVAEA